MSDPQEPTTGIDHGAGEHSTPGRVDDATTTGATTTGEGSTGTGQPHDPPIDREPESGGPIHGTSASEATEGSASG
jgi:hypothetical protein